MKIQLEKSEVYTAIHYYMLLKGFAIGEVIEQKWTPKEGLHSLTLDIEKHNKTDEETIRIIKNNLL